MEVDWPRRAMSPGVVNYMVRRLTTGHNDNRDFRPQHDGMPASVFRMTHCESPR